MSVSAYGSLIIGWRFKDEPLRVPDGKHFQCSISEHDLNGSVLYCPRCGSPVKEVARMVPSPLVAHFAERRGISVESALEILMPYQLQLPKEWSGSSGGWVLGMVLAKIGSHSWCEVPAEMPKVVRDLLIEAGMPVGGEKRYLAVTLH